MPAQVRTLGSAPSYIGLASAHAHQYRCRYEDIAKGKQIMTWRLTVAPKSTETIRYTVLYSNVPHQAS